MDGCVAKRLVVTNASERAIEIAKVDTFGAEMVATQEADR